ncbi:MAG: radical SAM protein [Chloroflexi bacterium]|nr:radical SAM protein [Chloroflexota bacterium]
MDLTKLYVEITSRCNLACRMCMLNTLDEPTGLMPEETFYTLLDQLAGLPRMPVLHLAGYGEPTSHPAFLRMVRAARAAGAEVEFTTNGTLLDEPLARAVVEAGVRRVVVSIDGVRPESYADIRLGSKLPEVLANMRRLRRIKIQLKGRSADPQVAIAFVAMKRNVDDIPQLSRLAASIGATAIIVSNLVPHTPEMEQEILYERSIATRHYTSSDARINISLPKMDVGAATVPALASVFQSRMSVSLLDADLGARDEYCRFVHDGYAALRWDGELSPCLDMLHTHTEYIHGRPRVVHHHSAGNISQTPLPTLWADMATFRQDVIDFNYSGCVFCAGCHRFAENREDCTEIADAPVCGGCLWAQGLVQCP